MNIKLDSTVSKVKFNGNEVDKVKYNGSVVWSKPVAQHIYGVSWSGTGTATAILTRTDDAINFADPVPYVNDGVMTGADCSSPFDNCYPWKGMVRETVNGNEMVKIPKFWYKVSGSSYMTSLQIADYPADGFLLSPAHLDRGYGEQDYIYVSRYCVDSNYQSKTNSTILGSVQESTARTNVRALGTGYELFDFALWQTLWMLYLVEFAKTDSRTLIGFGNDSGTKGNTGATDSMPYHTGTMAADTATHNTTSRIQYRNIEDLWGNCCYWIDGAATGYNNNTGYKLFRFEYLFTNYSSSALSSYAHSDAGIHGTANIKTLKPFSNIKINSTTNNCTAMIPQMGATITTYNYIGNTTFSASTSTNQNKIFYKNYTGLFGGTDTASTTSSANYCSRIQYLPFATSV